MATNLRYFSHEEMYDPKSYKTRKEASILGRLEVENYNSPPRRGSSVDPYEQSKARRRRIYENEYNRPYPARKKMHLWTKEDASSPNGSVSQVTPSPKSSWLGRDVRLDHDAPDDESMDELTPRELWRRATCQSIGTFGRKCVNGLSPPSMDRPSIIDFSSEVDADPSIIMVGTTTTGSAMVTPKRHESKTLLSNKDSSNSGRNNNYLSPVHTPTTSSTGSSGMSLEGRCLAIPSAPIKKTLDRIRPVVQESTAVLRARWQRAMSKEDEKPSWVIPDVQKHNESLGKLHKFLQTKTENQLKLFIDDYQESTFDRIVESFYGNAHLKMLMIQRNAESYSRGTHRSQQEMMYLFEAIRCLPQLKSLIVVNAHEAMLPALVENLPNNLRQFKLHMVQGDIPSICLDALASHPNLRKIDLEPEQSIDIGRLVSSVSIQCIKIRGVIFSMDETHMEGLADALSCNPGSSLKSLDMEPSMEFASWKHLADAIRFHTRLESLEVSVVANTFDEADAAAIVLAELLQVNTTLTHIVNKTNDTLNVAEETVNGPVLDALLANKSLIKLRFFEEDPLFWMAKDAILKRNKECFDDNEDGNGRQAFFDQYVSFATLLPGFKQKMCAYC